MDVNPACHDDAAVQVYDPVNFMSGCRFDQFAVLDVQVHDLAVYPVSRVIDFPAFELDHAGVASISDVISLMIRAALGESESLTFFNGILMTLSVLNRLPVWSMPGIPMGI